MPAEPVASAGRTASLTRAIAGNRQLGQEEFLKLLITQLTNQDPLSPQDDKEFLAQMAQFSTVEGVAQMSQSMGQLQAAGLIGRTVDAVDFRDGMPAAITGVVKAVRFEADGVHLRVEDQELMLNQVREVRQ